MTGRDARRAALGAIRDALAQVRSLARAHPDDRSRARLLRRRDDLRDAYEWLSGEQSADRTLRMLAGEVVRLRRLARMPDGGMAEQGYAVTMSDVEDAIESLGGYLAGAP